MTFRVLVTGSRDWRCETTIRQALAAAHAMAGWRTDDHGRPDAVLVTGRCPTGADAIAERIWASWGLPTEPHEADWTRGRKAGPERNQRMVSLGANVCLAFIRNGSRGASRCADLAERAGIPTVRWVA